MKKILLATLAFATVSTAFAGQFDTVDDYQANSLADVTSDHVRLQMWGKPGSITSRVSLPAHYLNIDAISSFQMCVTHTSTGAEECTGFSDRRTRRLKTLTLVEGDTYSVSFTGYSDQDNTYTAEGVVAVDWYDVVNSKASLRAKRGYLNIKIGEKQVESADALERKNYLRSRYGNRSQKFKDMRDELNEINADLKSLRELKASL